MNCFVTNIKKATSGDTFNQMNESKIILFYNIYFIVVYSEHIGILYSNNIITNNDKIVTHVFLFFVLKIIINLAT